MIKFTLIKIHFKDLGQKHVPGQNMDTYVENMEY